VVVGVRGAQGDEVAVAQRQAAEDPAHGRAAGDVEPPGGVVGRAGQVVVDGVDADAAGELQGQADGAHRCLTRDRRLELAASGERARQDHQREQARRGREVRNNHGVGV
jgi:hypothetical protein